MLKVLRNDIDFYAEMSGYYVHVYDLPIGDNFWGEQRKPSRYYKGGFANGNKDGLWEVYDANINLIRNTYYV
jgi:hypothetical protein